VDVPFLGGQGQCLLVVLAERLLVLGLANGLVGGDSAITDFLLELEHDLTAGLELLEQPFELLFAELLQEFFQLGAGFLELFQGVILRGNGVLVGKLLFGFLLLADAFLDLLASGRGGLLWLIGLVRLVRLITTLAAALALALTLSLAL